MNKQYLIMVPIDPVKATSMYPKDDPLPRHCTVMPWFESKLDSFHDLDQAVKRIAGEIPFKGMELVPERAELFGPKNDIPVHVLRTDEYLFRLHRSLLAFLSENDSLPEERQWIGLGYRPHVTDTQTKTFSPPERSYPETIALVMRNPEGHKFISSVHPLGIPPLST